MRQIWRPLLMMLGLVLAGLAVHSMPGGASGLLERGGNGGRLAFVVVASLLCAVGLPRQIAAYAAAFAFGFWIGATLALVAQVGGCALDFIWARALGRPWVDALMRRRLGGRFARLDAFLSANPFAATLMLRLLPVGNNLVLNLLAGVSGVSATSFLLASLLGYVPQTLVFALLGAGTRVDPGTQLALGLILFAASALFGLLLLRRFRAVAPA